MPGHSPTCQSDGGWLKASTVTRGQNKQHAAFFKQDQQWSTYIKIDQGRSVFQCPLAVSLDFALVSSCISIILYQLLSAFQSGEPYSNDPSNVHRQACWKLLLVGSGNSKALLRSYLRCHCTVWIRGQTAERIPCFIVFLSCFIMFPVSTATQLCNGHDGGHDMSPVIGLKENMSVLFKYCSNGQFQKGNWKLLESANVKVEGRLVIAGARCKPSISTKTHTSGSVWRACTLKNLNRHQHHEIDGTDEIDWRWCKGRGY